MSPRWEVDDYRGPRGARPVRAFLDGLSEAARDRVAAALEMLASEGNALRFPRSRPLGAGLFELRISVPDGTLRLLYCFRPGRRVIVLHGFAKKTQKTPPEDLALAQARKADATKEA
ncbi:MAG TPA: type II toxin-antitoxin system RelE/ParE family toxin [Methylomirabilota bacterium]|nr:type II toxin-antitoxin system RelE/ParE family toxin [Methylomirabilota bacterium]